jgi:hypothetical protein
LGSADDTGVFCPQDRGSIHIPAMKINSFDNPVLAIRYNYLYINHFLFFATPKSGW